MGRPPNLELIPICLGTHEVIPDCDGDSTATDKAALPCSWRERCMGFQRHLEDTGHDEERYIEIVPITSRTMMDVTGWKRTAKPVDKTHDEFSKFCKGLSRLYAIRTLPSRRAVESDPSDSKTAEDSKETPRRRRGKPRGNAYSKDKDRQAEIRRLITHFCVELRQAMGRKLNLDRRGNSLILPGVMYLVDRRIKSGYVSIYCRKKSRGRYGRDAGVAAMVPRFKTLTLNISVPVDIRDIQRELGPTASTLTIEPVRDGVFKTIIKGLGKDQLEVLAGHLARLAEQGILELPPR